MRAMRHRDDKGAVSVVMSLCLVVLFGAAALVIDGGQIWTARRQLITATDAAALAEAQEYASGAVGCAGLGVDFVDSNYSGAEDVTCTRTGSGTSGTVTVSTSVTVSHQLAAILGRNSTVVESSSTASFGAASAVSGLRPLGLCNGSNGFLAWQASGHSTTQVFRISYGKDDISACGGAAVPGNWAIIDFNGGSNSNQETTDWIENGYGGTVEAGTWHEGDPGAFPNSVGVSGLIGETIFLPVFDAAQGNGANAQLHIAGFVSVVVYDVKANGDAADRYLDLQFVSAVAPGRCCEGGALDTGAFAIGLCRADDEGDCP
jgi:Flp pilus assembly protein TadG